MANRNGRWSRFLFPGKSASSGTYLFRLIWIGCLSVSIPVIAAGILFYQYSMDRINRQIVDENRSSLTLMKDRTERILQGIEQESFQLSLDPLINDFSNRKEDRPLIWHLNQLDQIKLVKNSDSYIQDISFYNNRDNTVLTNYYGVIDKQRFKYLGDMDRLLNMKSGSQWFYLQSDQQEESVAFVRKFSIAGDGSLQGVLVFEIDASLVNDFIQADTEVMIDGSEMVFVSYPGLSKLPPPERPRLVQQLNGLAALRSVRSSEANMDSLIADGPDGRPAQYVFVKSLYGRSYVSIIPKLMIEERVQWIRIITLLALGFLIIIVVLLTFFSTKKAYSPIEQLINHSHLLTEGRIQSSENEFDYIRASLNYLSQETERFGVYMEKVQPTLRERCLQQLVSGDYMRSETLIQDCNAYGIKVESAYCILIVEAENVYREKRFLPSDKPIVVFAITNVVQELTDKHPFLSGYVFPYLGKGVALLQWKSGAEQTGLPQGIREFAHSVNEALKSYLSFEASIGIGRCYSHIADVPVSYKEAEIALQYRIYRDTESVLYIEDLENSRKQATYRYPRELESTIVDLLVKGEFELAEQSLIQFTEAAKSSQSYNFIYQSYRVLLSSIITSLEKQGGSILDILEYNLFGQLESKQTAREIYDWFVKALFPLYSKLTEEYRSAVGQSAVLQVSKYIREHITDDLSLVQCAGMIGISPSHLSRQFKKEMGVNYLDYVMECKVGEAKKMLLETDLSVSEIAGVIGYSERNLIRIFQRYTKMNPGLYRAVHR